MVSYASYQINLDQSLHNILNEFILKTIDSAVNTAKQELVIENIIFFSWKSSHSALYDKQYVCDKNRVPTLNTYTAYFCDIRVIE